MCRVHWTEHTRALRKASVARKAEAARDPVAQVEPASSRSGRRAKAAPEPEADAA
jgi:hypothetical protein